MYLSLSMDVLPELIPSNTGILVAVSGGPDSVALAHILWRYINEHSDLGLRMVISHVNHQVRDESKDEAELVRKLAEKWQVPYVIHVFNAKKYAAEIGKSFEEASREWRYSRWQEDLRKYNLQLLATAHHLGDQAETVLFRLLRGSGTAGLAGIYPFRDNIIRPLLSVSKNEILTYCREEKLPYAIDKSNLEPCYDRNRIRIQLIPELERNYNDKIQQTLGRTAELLRWDEEFITAQAEPIWSKYCKEINNLEVEVSLEVWEQPEAILSRIFRRAASVVTGDPRGLEYKYIKKIMMSGRKKGWRQDFPGFTVETKRNGFFFFRRELVLEGSFEKKFSILNRLKDMHFELYLDEWQVIPEINLKVGIFQTPLSDTEILWSTEFDQSEVLQLVTPLTCRIRRPGDKIYFRNVGHKAIKKVFQESHISAEERSRMILFACGENVIWIPGICRSDFFLPKNFHSKLYGVVAKN